MTSPSLHRLRQGAVKRLGLDSFFRHRGDGRTRPRKPAPDPLRAIRAGPRGGGLSRRLGDDTLACFTERLDPAPTRQASRGLLHHAKRNKAFDNSPASDWPSTVPPSAAATGPAAPSAAAEQRFSSRPPERVLMGGQNGIEL